MNSWVHSRAYQADFSHESEQMTKKLIMAVVVVGALVGSYFYLRTHAQVSIGMLEGKTVKSYRGDLVVPITASGKIEPLSVVQIKGKASGEVVETPFTDGAMVRKGDMIVRLDRADEQRNYDRAKADQERARIALERAELAVKEKEDVAIPRAVAALAQSQSSLALALYDLEKVKRLQGIREADPNLDTLTGREFKDAKARYDMEVAALEVRKAEVEQANIAKDLATLEVDTAQETLTTATKTLEDAAERLSETTVVSPIDGMVLKRHVQTGEVVQSGKTSLTGGTVLMEIADVSEIYAVVNVDEADIGQVRQLAPPSARPGPTATQPATLPSDIVDKEQVVEITIESFRDEKFFGQIERIAPQSQLMQAIATFQVWIRITSENRNKLIGLLNTQAEAHFTVNSVKDAVLVNYDAIMRDPNGEGYGVYVQVFDPESKKTDEEFRPCTFGMDNGIDVEVVEGLAAGETVYTQLPMKTRREKEAEESEKE